MNNLKHYVLYGLIALLWAIIILFVVFSEPAFGYTNNKEFIQSVNKCADYLDKRYKKGVLGYTYPSTVKQWIYKSFFIDATYKEVSQNLTHEWMHKIGFGHPSKKTSTRKYSVPYACGYFVRDYK